MITRLIAYVALIAALVVGAVWLADRPGSVLIRWQGWRLDTSVPVLLMAVLAIYVAMALLVKLVLGFVRAPGRFWNWRQQARQKAGYQALADGMAAVAAGDRGKAKRLSHQAEKKLRDPSVTALLTAQAAQLSGHTAEAEEKFKSMTERPQSALAGYKGLMALAHQEGNLQSALTYAEKAWAIGTPSEGLGAAYFDLCVRLGEWDKAETMLRDAKSRKVFNGGDYTRRMSLIRSQQSLAASRNSENARAAKLGQEAHKIDPGMVEAALQAADATAKMGDRKKAHKILARAYDLSGHPQLLLADLSLTPAQPPLDQVKRLEKMVKSNPAPVDGHIVLADTALKARLYGLARSHLEIAAETRPSAGIFTRLAALERAERGDEAKALTWLAKAADAPSDPAWLCSRCHQSTGHWQPVCPHCQAVDSLDWAQPVHID